MEGGLPSILGIAFILLALWRAVRVRRDLARSETRIDRALFGDGKPISRWDNPVRFWCAIGVNIVVVFLFAIVAAVAFRVLALRRL